MRCTTRVSGWVIGLAIPLLAHSATVPIHDIQGAGGTSPLAGTNVTTSGIVTALKTTGFFLQVPEAEMDADPATSEGIFCQLPGTPPAPVVIGNRIQLSGLVAEIRAVGESTGPTLTALRSVTAVTLLGTGNPLPPPVLLGPAQLRAEAPADLLERYEGMRVRVEALEVIGPTQGSVSDTTGTAISSGVFHGVLPGVARAFREPGVYVTDPLPPGAPCCVPRFDGNPEVLRVDGDGQRGVAAREVATGALVTNLVGVLEFESRAYSLVPDQAVTVVRPGLAAAGPVPAPATGWFTVAAVNLGRLYDGIDDPATTDVVLPAATLAARLRKASLVIRGILRAPEILAVREVESLGALQALAQQVSSDAVALGEPDPGYAAFIVAGNSTAGLNVGFLVAGGRVRLESITQLGQAATYVNPANGQSATLFDNPPLVLRASVPEAGSGRLFPLIVVAIQFSGRAQVGDPVDGPRQRSRRDAQARFVAGLVQSLQTASPAAGVMVAGGFDADGFSDGYVDVVGTVKGTPAPADRVVLAGADLVTPDLTNLSDTLPPEERYSTVLDGQARSLNHLLVNGVLRDRRAWSGFARINADFPMSLRGAFTRPERLADEDPAVAHFLVAMPVRFTAVRRLANGRVSLVARGDASRTNLVQASATPTANWQTLGAAGTNQAGELIFTDAGATNLARRFYRIIAP